MARFISVAKAANLIGVSNREMQAIVNQGELPVVKGKICLLYTSPSPRDA